MKIIFWYLFATYHVTLKSSPHDSYAKIKNRPLNIAHRGLSSIIPENTIPAFEAALYQGADFIELDVLLTKQKQLIVMHDAYLSKITNADQFQEYSSLKETRYYAQQTRHDLWADQFTVQQLKKFTVKQNGPVKNRISSLDNKIHLSTLNEVIQAVINFNKIHLGARNPDKRLGGIMIQAKDGEIYRDKYSIEIGDYILQILQKNNLSKPSECEMLCPIILQSFDLQTIQNFAKKSELPRIYLSKHKERIQQDLQQIRKYATGLGIKQSILYNYESNQIDYALLQKIRSQQLLIYIWKFNDDALLFNASDNIKMYEIAQNVMKIDGIITQFSDIYTPISQMFRRQTYRNSQESTNFRSQTDNQL